MNLTVLGLKRLSSSSSRYLLQVESNSTFLHLLLFWLHSLKSLFLIWFPREIFLLVKKVYQEANRNLPTCCVSFIYPPKKKKKSTFISNFNFCDLPGDHVFKNNNCHKQEMELEQKVVLPVKTLCPALKKTPGLTPSLPTDQNTPLLDCFFYLKCFRESRFSEQQRRCRWWGRRQRRRRRRRGRRGRGRRATGGLCWGGRTESCGVCRAG